MSWHCELCASHAPLTATDCGCYVSLCEGCLEKVLRATSCRYCKAGTSCDRCAMVAKKGSWLRCSASGCPLRERLQNNCCETCWDIFLTWLPDPQWLNYKTGDHPCNMLACGHLSCTLLDAGRCTQCMEAETQVKTDCRAKIEAEQEQIEAKSIAADLQALKHVKLKSATFKTFIAELASRSGTKCRWRKPRMQVRIAKKRKTTRLAPSCTQDEPRTSEELARRSRSTQRMSEMIPDRLDIELERMCTSSRSSRPGAVGSTLQHLGIPMKPAMPPTSAIPSMPCGTATAPMPSSSAAPASPSAAASVPETPPAKPRAPASVHTRSGTGGRAESLVPDSLELELGRLMDEEFGHEGCM